MRSRETNPATRRYLVILGLAAALSVITAGCWTSAPRPPATPSALALLQSTPLTPSGPALSATPSEAAEAASTPTPTAVPPTATPVPPTATPLPPTATPPPPPTPTPRVKPPPSPYQRLQDYPRPAGDNGYGFHITAEPYLPRQPMLQSEVIPLLKALGVTWVTVWSSSDLDEQVESARILVQAGFEVLLRFHEIKPPHPDYVPPESWLRKFRAVGIRYFVAGNEPNLTLENPSRAGPDFIARQWMQSADRIKAAGGIPLLYPMSPGGNVADHREMLVGMLEWLKANDALDTLDGAGVAIHNRPLGKPLEMRDSTSFLEYEWIDDTVARYAGKHLPLFGTEAGYAFGEQIIPSLPRIDGELHRQYNLAIITGFRDGRWRDSLFAQTFWILSGFGYREFIADWWVANPLNYGKDLPIVEALKALPKFKRKFSAPGFK